MLSHYVMLVDTINLLCNIQYFEYYNITTSGNRLPLVAGERITSICENQFPEVMDTNWNSWKNEYCISKLYWIFKD